MSIIFFVLLSVILLNVVMLIVSGVIRQNVMLPSVVMPNDANSISQQFANFIFTTFCVCNFNNLTNNDKNSIAFDRFRGLSYINFYRGSLCQAIS